MCPHIFHSSKHPSQHAQPDSHTHRPGSCLWPCISPRRFHQQLQGQTIRFTSRDEGWNPLSFISPALQTCFYSTFFPCYPFSQGKVVLFVNVASRCGFTGQYEGLEALHKKYKSQGLLVIGIPSNDFKQEPADGESCRLNFGVTFPILEKCHVNGEEQHELYRNLKAQKSRLIGRGIIWNFEKILVGRDGKVVDRYHPSLQPLALEPWIEKELGL
ncbi:thioredoxin-like protein [Chytriomyces cf. hyalinus JEL632]|nr:thioredoxin-like protein [Chytriomyces cf. hyalinus JEL632]